MEKAKSGSLHGIGVVITRPLAHAQRVARLVHDAGGNAILFPALEIVDLDNHDAIDTLIDRLQDFDIAIFVSQNAVERGLALVKARGDFPAGLRVAAVGAATASALEDAGCGDVIQPRSGSDSEALLATPDLQNVKDKRIVIFRGVGGRETLNQALTQRGAQVEYAQCYVRRRPQIDAAPLLKTWSAGAVQAVNVMSEETLRNFYALLGERGQDLLIATPVFVPHPAIAEAARGLGCREVDVTQTGDRGLLYALEQRFRKVTTT